jgi:CRP-like cAMP-binding protein
MTIAMLKAIDIYAITPELELHLYQILQHDTIKKGQQLLSLGEICKRVWFIEKGLFKSYRINRGQKEITWFMKEENVMHSPKSFYSGTPSKHVIEALEDSELFSISKSQLEEIYQRFPAFERVGRQLTEIYYLISLDNWEALASGTVKARYNHFLKTQSGLTDRITAKDLASFLKCADRSIYRVWKKKN